MPEEKSKINKSRSLIYTIFPIYFLIIILSLVLVVFFSVSRFRDFYLEQKKISVAAELGLMTDKMALQLEQKATGALQKQVEHWAKNLGMRLTVIAPDGAVLCDSEAKPQLLDNHADRTEFVLALEKGLGTSKRTSRLNGKKFLYVAQRIDAADKPLGVVRMAVPVLSLEQTFRPASREVLFVFIGVVLLSGLISFIVARRISQPLSRLKNRAQALASGDLSQKITLSGNNEVVELAESMNRLARDLENQITTLTQERHQRDAILFSMVEGVLALDSDEKIINHNRAVLDLFNVKDSFYVGKSLTEVFRHPELFQFVNKLFQSPSFLETTLVVENQDDEKYLRAYGNLLRDLNGKILGVLVVFHDITRLRELEGMRKNFVANVSHELKTPLTAIKGFVETLEEGAIDDAAQARTFLKIISAQTQRLTETIQNLLDLSQIERESADKAFGYEEVEVPQIVYAAIEICQHKADQKAIRIFCECKKTFKARVNPRLIEQAVINLIDNAIQYSNEKSEIKINVECGENEFEIRVQDFGMGIEPKHHEKIFERFYRTDSSRSRHLGGSGLGLAIVKHILKAHKGRVDLQSQLGVGSVFRLIIPLS